jgi:hypothetical protein
VAGVDATGYRVRQMKPDPLDDLGNPDEDRRENRRAIVVAVVALLVVALACGALLATR